MIPAKLKTRLDRNRPMTSITLRIPVDVVDSLKSISPHKGLSGYQALIKTYVVEGLRVDEARYIFAPAAHEARLIDVLKKQGVSNEVINATVLALAA
jgi:uncharacterized protein YpmB